MNKEANITYEGNFEEMFPIVDIKGVSLEDRFMQYEPETKDEMRIKDSIIEAKKIGMKNFRIPAMDPAFGDDGETIIYCAGRKPATDKSPRWWYENAPKFMPTKNSRLKDSLEADAVLGIRIKYLVEEEGYEVKAAWKAICVDSSELGNFSKSLIPGFISKNPEAMKLMDEAGLENTGSRKVGPLYDLGNTCKLIKKHGVFVFEAMGGYCGHTGKRFPLSSKNDCPSPDQRYEWGVGELAIDV